MSFIPQKLFVAVFESDPKFRHAWGACPTGTKSGHVGGTFYGSGESSRNFHRVIC